MGQVIGKIQQRCCQTYYYNKLKEETEETFIQKQAQDLLDDHRYFFKQQWFGKQPRLLFVPEKFLLQYYGYQQDQIEMEKYWTQIDLRQEIKHGFIERQGNEVLNPKWKYLIRRGVPINIMRDIILDIFKKTYENNETEYLETQNIVFKGQKPPESFKHVPLFNDHNVRLEEVLKISILNEQGVQALGKICWTLNQTFMQIEYNPMVIQIANIMLIFLTEAETFCVLHFMLEDSVKLLEERDQENNAELQRSLRWHFMLNKSQYERFCKLFFDTVCQKSKTFTQIMAHFKKIGFNYFELISDMIDSLFIGYLHFPTVLRFFIMFMNEGIKIYFRMCYALCFMLKDEILANNDKSHMKNLIKDQSLKLNQKQVKAMINKGFQLRLPSTANKLSKYSYNASQNQRRIYYLPFLKTPSNILTGTQLETIWEYIPSYLRLIDPHRLFSTQENGFSLQQLYLKTEQYKDFPCLYIIKTAKEDVFGFFVDQNLQAGSSMHYYGNDECFVYSLQPEEHFYESAQVNNNHIYSEKDYFSIGGSQKQQTGKTWGVAIQLDDSLHKGLTQYCETYDSPPLTGNKSQEFQLQEMEVYAFISELEVN